MSAEDNPAAALLVAIQLTNVEMFRLLDKHGVLASEKSIAGLRSTANNLPDDMQNRDLVSRLLMRSAEMLQIQRPIDPRSLFQVFEGGRADSD